MPYCMLYKWFFVTAFVPFNVATTSAAYTDIESSIDTNEEGRSFRNHDSLFIKSSSNMRTTTISLPRQNIFEHHTSLHRNSVPIPRIVGGTEISPSSHPYLVALYRLYRSGYTRFICGGSLIASNLILTAAHCVDKSQDILAKLGIYNINSDSDEQNENMESIRVIRIILHPNYNSINLLYDYAVLELEWSATKTTNHYTTPIAIAKEAIIVNSELHVLGWGTTSFEGRYSSMPLHGTVYYLDQSECISRFKSGVIGESMMCAWASGVDACQGDSGGPLVMEKENDKGEIVVVLVGVVSWGYECAHDYYPGVYSRLAGDEGISMWLEEICVEIENCGGIGREEIESPFPTLEPSIESTTRDSSIEPSIHPATEEPSNVPTTSKPSMNPTINPTDSPVTHTPSRKQTMMPTTEMQSYESPEFPTDATSTTSTQEPMLDFQSKIFGQRQIFL